jgi:predicted MPP superfamily phosphohydrolase
MVFIFILSLIIFVQIIFSAAFFTSDNAFLIGLGIIQLTLLCVSFVVLFLSFKLQKTSNYLVGFTAFGGMILSSVPGIGFFVFGSIYFFTKNEAFFYIGMTLSSLLFLAILIGIIWGRWNWKIHRFNLAFEHLPAAFNGVKIVQISDIHVGSFFNNHKKVEKAIQKINHLDADYVVFTGDLVNNTAAEMNGWVPVFSKINARKGKYSILGNHDYGDYVKWSDDAMKKENLSQLIEIHRAIGFTPLLNQSHELGAGFWLLGVENWGKRPFRQSGKLTETLAPIPNDAFKLLLSHDPSHFDEQVIQTNIDLTLSGHTHGMQFGIERFGIKWSPVSFKYKKWAGLYQVGKQFLYVNRGFGYLGFPGRVGIYPEITEIVLTKKSVR